MIMRFMNKSAVLFFLSGCKLAQASDFANGKRAHVATEAGSVEAKPDLTKKTLAFTELYPYNDHDRDLQTTANFRARYVGRFQAFEDSSCATPSPVLRAYCIGDIAIESTSSPSIVCTPLAAGIGPAGSNGIECVNTCTGTACESIYLKGSIGEVFFSCSGPGLYDVGSLFTWEDSGDGSCQADPTSSGVNFHVASMGVFCDDVNGFVFDDYFFDCPFPFPLDSNPGDEYSCISGKVCEGNVCTVDYNIVIVEADVPYFQDRCVESLTGLTITPAPSPGVITPGFSVIARFEASWAIEVDEASASSCSGSARTLRMTCTNGGAITLIDNVSTSVQCSNPSPDVLECTDSSKGTNEFHSVVYVSTRIVLSPDPNRTLF